MRKRQKIGRDTQKHTEKEIEDSKRYTETHRERKRMRKRQKIERDALKHTEKERG